MVMDDLLSEFLTETNEGLAVLDVEVVKLEQNPNDTELLGNIFRLIHTIKGTCGFLGLPRLESVAHAGESIMDKFRSGELIVTPEGVSLILECLDQIRVLLVALEQTESEPEGEDTDLIKRLNAAAEGGAGASVSGSAESGGGGAMSEELEAAFQAVNGPPSAEAPKTAATKPEPKQAAAKAEESSVANQSIRVNVDLLENLMTMVSELVLTRNQLLQILRSQKDSEFAAPLQRLNHVVSELQEGVMKTRMQPIGYAWAKLPRIIRDLSIELDKKIDLVMQGAETELDRQVLELIKDPLTHIVRNSADHGLENAEERLAAGKPEVGKITLKAFHEGGHIIVQIIDDGCGLFAAKIKKKVIENGLATEAELESMTEQQIQSFIFKPGFSTATTVTSVSGRGVGMDVVRTNIEKIGGTIELNSVEGKGTTLTIKIPLTLAIVSALIVACGGERFAIPQINVRELVRASSHSENTIERINGTPVLRLRNRLLPLVSLHTLLRLGETAGPIEEVARRAAEDDAESAATEAVNRGDKRADNQIIVVSQVGSYTFGLIVDRVFDTEDIVVKPVARILRDIQMFSGSTILGDGSVVMILDPNGIAAATGEVELAEVKEDDSAERNVSRSGETAAILVFRAVEKTLKAVPLALVARLEEIDLAKVETSNGQNVVQYRGQLMPLVQMEGAGQLKDSGRQPVVVFADRDRVMGLIVDEIVDIVEDRLNVELKAKRTGYVGSAIIAGQATDIVDVSHYLTSTLHDWFGGESNGAFEDSSGSRILLIDDSPFFRNLLSPLLLVAGYDVTAVESAQNALELCAAGQDFDVIISDIEMPGMNGFEFAETVKNDTRWSNTPLVALSSYATQKDFARGRAVGFLDYVAKNDRESLLSTLHDTLTEARGAA